MVRVPSEPSGVCRLDSIGHELSPIVRKSFFLVNLRFKNQLQEGNLVLNASFAPGPGRFRSRVLFHAHRSRSVQVPCFIPCPQVQVGSGLGSMWPKNL